MWAEIFSNGLKGCRGGSFGEGFALYAQESKYSPKTHVTNVDLVKCIWYPSAGLMEREGSLGLSH